MSSTVLEPSTASPPKPTLHRSSWLWLLIGAVLLPFTLFQTVVPAAAWLAPVFLLRFVRTQRARVALPMLAAVGFASVLIGMRGFFPGAEGVVYGLAGLGMVIPYGADRWLASRFGRFSRTLIFPIVDTAISFGASFAGDLGTMGTPAYAQVGNLATTKVVAVTGFFGLSFLIAWAAPVANDLWEHGFDLRSARRTFGVWLTTVLAVLVGGGMWVALFPATAPTVRVAGLAPSRQLVEAFEGAAGPGESLGEVERAAFHQATLQPLIDDMFDRTAQAAAGGARIVVWSEAAVFVFKQEEAALIERARQAARTERIYLQVGLVTILPTTEFPFNENRAIMFDPSGEVVWDYHKATVPLNDGNAPGPGVIPFVDTPHGRIATIICFDADFPGLVRQAGKAGVDILLIPSSDFGTLGETHARMSVLRAVENGTAIFRPTRKGVSLAADHNGRVIAYQDDYPTGAEQTLWASVPTHGARTIYSVLGDWPGWGSVLGLFAFVGVGLLRRRH